MDTWAFLSLYIIQKTTLLVVTWLSFHNNIQKVSLSWLLGFLITILFRNHYSCGYLDVLITTNITIFVMEECSLYKLFFVSLGVYIFFLRGFHKEDAEIKNFVNVPYKILMCKNSESINMVLYCTVSDLKQILAISLVVMWNTIDMLYFLASFFQDNKQLIDYNIQQQSILFLSGRLNCHMSQGQIARGGCLIQLRGRGGKTRINLGGSGRIG